MSIQVDQNEHSLEMHLPFISKIMAEKTNGPYGLIPILVGSPSQQNETQIARTLAPYLQDSSSLFVISSDFCHWGSRFDYTPCASTKLIHEHIEALDGEGMELISR